MSNQQALSGVRTIASLILTLSATLLTACQTTGAGEFDNAIHVSRNLLPIDSKAAAYGNLYDAIEHLRPEYLRVHQDGSTSLTPVAYLDGVRLADPSMLRIVPVSWVADVRWVRPNETSILYRASHQLGGGIFVRTRQSGAP
jgi:hypothetical protein